MVQEDGGAFSEWSDGYLFSLMFNLFLRLSHILF